MEKRKILKFHIAFWLLVILVTLPETLFYVSNPLFIPILTGTISIFFYDFLSFYFFYIYLSKFIQTGNKYIKLVLYSLTFITISGFLVTFFSYYLYVFTYPLTMKLNISHYKWVTSYIYGVMGVGTLFSMLGLLSRIALFWYNNKINQTDTEKQNLVTELAMLKAQVNPHFLFNTLNNIKSLITSLPIKAVYSIDKLNGIMDYMLNEASQTYIPIEKEIDYIKDYIELERIRYSNPGFISFQIKGDYTGIKIPPLILMPFIENAFKHGNKLITAPGITFLLDIKGNEISFSAKNYIKENTETFIKSSGFGLKNIKRRLELLYGSRYELEIKNTNKEFLVNLKLDQV